MANSKELFKKSIDELLEIKHCKKYELKKANQLREEKIIKEKGKLVAEILFLQSLIEGAEK